MNNRNVNCRTTIPALLIALAFTCISSVTAQVGERGPEGAIVGLWQVHYTSVACDQPVLPPEFFTYQQFHSDGLEIETPIFAPGVCMGAWRQMGHMVQIHHVGWTPGGIPGFPQIVRFEFTETITVGHDRNSLDGTVDQTFYDAPVGGNVVAQCTAITHATRISVP